MERDEYACEARVGDDLGARSRAFASCSADGRLCQRGFLSVADLGWISMRTMLCDEEVSSESPLREKRVCYGCWRTFVTTVPNKKNSIKSQKNAGHGCSMCIVATKIPTKIPPVVSLLRFRAYATRPAVARICGM